MMLAKAVSLQELSLIHINVPLELLHTMIFSTNKYKYFSNTKRLRDALGKLVTQQWLQEASLCNMEEGNEDGDQEDPNLQH